VWNISDENNEELNSMKKKTKTKEVNGHIFHSLWNWQSLIRSTTVKGRQKAHMQAYIMDLYFKIYSELYVKKIILYSQT